MKTINIKDYKNGWLIGDFDPAILKTSSFEMAHHSYKKDNISDRHTHKIATEYNYIVSGKLMVSGILMTKGDMFIYEPGDFSDVCFLEDADIIVIKVPSIPSDKYEV